MFNHYLWSHNEHAWKVEDGKTRGSGSEDRENECSVTIDPRLCELIDLGAPIRAVFAIEEKINGHHRSKAKS
jgi:hypothetical protein